MKMLVRRFLQNFGYDIVKVSPRSIVKKDKLVKVGKFELTMPSINPLIFTYRSQPDFGTEIARIVLAVEQKYPTLSILDVGANTGDTASIIKSVSNVPIVCIEGDSISFSYLQKNTASFSSMRLFNQYLGEKDESKKIAFDKKGWNTTLIPSDEATTGEELKLKTLDSLLEENKLLSNNYKVLKIDTEGFDTIILRGSFKTLENSRPVIYIEYNRDNMEAIKEDGLSTLLSLTRFGYEKALFYDDRGRFLVSADLKDQDKIRELHHYANGKFANIYYYNICLVHHDDLDLAAAIINTEMNRL